MEKDLNVVYLFDLYKELLTEKQRELFSSYYFYDLSLSEIAEPLNLTRQSVYESIKTVKEKLIEYEKSLKLFKKNESLKALAEIYGGELRDKIMEIIGE